MLGSGYIRIKFGPDIGSPAGVSLYLVYVRKGPSRGVVGLDRGFSRDEAMGKGSG